MGQFLMDKNCVFVVPFADIADDYKEGPEKIIFTAVISGREGGWRETISCNPKQLTYTQ